MEAVKRPRTALASQSARAREVWPNARPIKHTSTSQEEGCTRLFATNTTEFVPSKDDPSTVGAINTVQVKWGPKRKITPIKDSEGSLEADIVLIALGYSHPSQKAFEKAGLAQDERHNFKATTQGANAFQSSDPQVFVTGDCRKGQSLVVYALAEGRDCALSVYQQLMALPCRTEQSA